MSDTPVCPSVPSWSNLKVFLWGLAWAAAAGVAPAAVMVQGWLSNWSTPINWNEVLKVAAAGAIFGAFGYIRKHLALLSPPPEQK